MDGGAAVPWCGVLALGLVAGLLSGTLGVGSGAIVVPALVLLFGSSQKSAQGTALAMMVPMVLVGAIRYKLNPEVEMKAWPVFLLALGAVGGVLVGAEVAARLPARVLTRLFAAFLIAVALKMAFHRPRPDGGAPTSSRVKEAAAQRTLGDTQDGDRR